MFLLPPVLKLLTWITQIAMWVAKWTCTLRICHIADM